MKYKMTAAIERKGSANSQKSCYLLTFKGEDGKSYQLWTDSGLGNFKRWYDIICAFTGVKNRGEELWFNDLVLRRGSKNQIDADSRFKTEVITLDNNFYPDKPAPSERQRKDLD